MMVLFTERQLKTGKRIAHKCDDAPSARAKMQELCGDGAQLVAPRTKYRGHVPTDPYVLSRDGSVRCDGKYIAAIWRGKPLPPAPMPLREATPGEKLPEVTNKTNPGTHPPDAVKLPDGDDASESTPEFEMPSPRAKREVLDAAVAAWNESASEALQVEVDLEAAALGSREKATHVAREAGQEASQVSPVGGEHATR